MAMKITKGLSLPPNKRGRVEIPDCSRDDLPALFAELGFRRGAEIGVRTGEFSERLCLGGQKVYAVDPWLEYPDYRESIWRPMEEEYEEACRRLQPYDCIILRKTSMAALDDFRDRSLDWVYIDGNHALAFAMQDIYFWSKKVRRGGVIAGHDYFRSTKPHRYAVKEAVDLYTLVYRISPWYVLGRREKREGETRDKWRSWFWFNP